MYSPAQFGKMIGKSVKTLQRWDSEGILVAHRNPKNRRYYTHDQYLEYIGVKANETKSKIVVYGRVSSPAQKTDLKNQVSALEVFCAANGFAVDEWLTEVGSGLNYKRKKFNSLFLDIEMGKVSKVIIAHKDRLIRFGFEWFEAFAQRHGCEIVVMNQESLSPAEEVTQDLLAIIHCFSSRLYGLRKYKKEITDIAKTKED
ncbi:IS607 family transposase [Photobacterium damselae]|uniref:IS607 family transposase n=1 Tax=Photobacterium damselae TaxID=38293 RepID=UPI001EED7BE1|nr:IS607 family transposase [Photobacterium damselae]UKA04907.1 IS607 family transposase [Photobacterium damselae subsp. damselae]